MNPPTGSRPRIVWAVLIPAMTLPFLAAWFYFDVFSEFLFSRWLYAATKVFTVVWPFVAIKLILRQPWPSVEFKDSRHRNALGFGLLSGAVIVGLMFVLMQTGIGNVVRENAPSIRQKTEDLGVIEHYWAFGFFIAFIHSFIEEYYWRWFVYGRLRTVLPGGSAHVLAGMAFAAHHIIITTQYFPLGLGIALGSMVGLGGVVWSLMYARQGTLAGSWISHVLADLGILSIGHKLLFGSWI